MTKPDRERNSGARPRGRDDAVPSEARGFEQEMDPSVVRGIVEAGRGRMRSAGPDAESEQRRIDLVREREAFERGRPYGLE